jgi:hypothetical protein
MEEVQFSSNKKNNPISEPQQRDICKSRNQRMQSIITIQAFAIPNLPTPKYR